MNAVLHQPIKNAINYIKSELEDRTTQIGVWGKNKYIVTEQDVEMVLIFLQNISVLKVIVKIVVQIRTGK